MIKTVIGIRKAIAIPTFSSTMYTSFPYVSIITFSKLNVYNYYTYFYFYIVLVDSVLSIIIAYMRMWS